MHKILRGLALILILAVIAACADGKTKISTKINEFERAAEEIKTETERGEKLGNEYGKLFKGRIKKKTPGNIFAKITIIREESEWLRELELFNKIQLSVVELIKSDIDIKKSLNKIKVRRKD